ncbi:MAG TPA: TetR/AcrR family transcriptional regulator [Actinomycetota bacterium]|nr:TetR/AcrR family transcriptional regulator [Actinomycetota bacterium]
MAQTAERTRTARRAEMVRAAARLFSERGYHGTSMQHLADALGLLRGSLYAHIGSKEELLFDVVDEGADRFLARAEEALAVDGGAAARLRALLAGHVETAIEHIDAATVFLNEWRYLADDLRAVVQDKRDRYEAMVRSVVEDGVARGEFRADADVRFAVLLVLSAGNWVYEWYRPGGALSPRAVGERFADLIVKGLEPGEGRR